MSDRIGEIERENADLKLRIDELNQSNDKLKQNNAILNDSIAALKSSYEIIKKNNAALKQDNEELSSSNDRLKQNIDELNKSIDELKTKNDALNKEIAELKGRNAILGNENEGLKKGEHAISLRNAEMTPEEQLNGKITDELLKKMGIQIAKEKKRKQVAAILQNLRMRETLTLNELVQALNIPSETLNRLISMLNDVQLVRRNGGKKFGAYCLTEEGRKFFESEKN